jgi:transcriptional regulator with XRE-family HTH domain
MTFGSNIKNRRIDGEMTLREFSKRIEMDPSNWSKVERGVIPPPSDEKLMQRIIGILGVKDTDQQEFRDLADLARGQIPADLRDDKLLAKMPAFFRGMRGQEYSKQDFEKLKQGVKNLHTAKT